MHAWLIAFVDEIKKIQRWRKRSNIFNLIVKSFKQLIIIYYHYIYEKELKRVSHQSHQRVGLPAIVSQSFHAIRSFCSSCSTIGLSMPSNQLFSSVTWTFLVFYWFFFVLLPYTKLDRYTHSLLLYCKAILPL